jgi:uncharacterized RDD family membrane protein YckC
MKCPKCQYISFDSGDRCRNCGYEFSLSPDLAIDDLPIQNGTEPIGPLADFSLNEPSATPNLPLFGRDTDPDAPLVTPSATPRAPLSVRRTAPTAPRARARRDNARPERDAEPRLALDTAEFPIVAPPPARSEPAFDPVAGSVTETDSPAAIAEGGMVVAPAGARLVAGLVDLGLAASIDLVVIYFTLKICELGFAQVLLLPAAPMLSFLALLNLGYAATFVAAGGQTIGKMATGIRVIPADPAARATERVTFGHAAVRAAGYVVSALPAGLGFVPAFVGQERRALHDRLADTRVVKA